jgi:hypothetical protein
VTIRSVIENQGNLIEKEQSYFLGLPDEDSSVFPEVAARIHDLILGFSCLIGVMGEEQSKTYLLPVLEQIIKNAVQIIEKIQLIILKTPDRSNSLYQLGRILFFSIESAQVLYCLKAEKDKECSSTI